jgi:GTP-binding protein HflX
MVGDDIMDKTKLEKFERTLLVGSYQDDEELFLYSMEELKNLALSCELDVVDQIVQKIRTITSRTYFGSGKIDEIKEYVDLN